MVLYSPEGYGVIINREHSDHVRKHTPQIAEHFSQTDKGELILFPKVVWSLLNSPNLSITINLLRPLLFAFRQQSGHQRLSNALGLVIDDYQPIKHGEQELDPETIGDLTLEETNRIDDELGLTLGMLALTSTFKKFLNNVAAKEKAEIKDTHPEVWQREFRRYVQMKKRLNSVPKNQPNKHEIKAAKVIRATIAERKKLK